MPIDYQGTGGGIPRKTAKIFAKDANANDVTVFGSTLDNNTQYTKDIANIQNSDFEAGWRNAVISNKNYPLMGDMNGIQMTFSQQIAYALQHGIPQWDSSTEYYAYDIVNVNGILYISTYDNNTGNNPVSSNKWAVFYDPDMLLNKITNCILEAPNGVCSASGATITVYSGLKVLMPNGRNADGTLKNIEYTVASNITGTSTVDDSWGLLVITNTGAVYGIYFAGLYSGLDANKPATSWAPNMREVYYATDTNKMYLSQSTGTTTNWIETPLAIISKVTAPGGGYAATVEPYQPTYILKNNDQAMVTNWAFPSEKYLSYTINTSGTQYTSPADGFWCLYISVSSSQRDMKWVGLNNLYHTLSSVSTTVAEVGAAEAILPVSKGQKIYANYSPASGTITDIKLYFTYAKGEEL